MIRVSSALYGSLFTDNTEAAFANYRLWESLGFFMTYIYQNAIGTRSKIYICMICLLLGFAGYLAVEVLEAKKRINSRLVSVYSH